MKINILSSKDVLVFQIGDNADLQDVVRFLELEHYFSTKSPAQSKSTTLYNIQVIIIKSQEPLLLSHTKVGHR